MKVGELFDLVEGVKARSAWEKGVKEYALELLGWIEDEDSEFQADALLVGAKNWKEYSYKGWSLIYDADIAERLCSPEEYRRTNGGAKAPSRRETWKDVQARALAQAADFLCKMNTPR